MEMPTAMASKSPAREGTAAGAGNTTALRLLILVVIYRRRWRDSETLRSLAACADALRDSLVIVWDNSPDPADEDDRRWLDQSLPRVECYHDATNLGLASLYNRTIQRYLKSEASEAFDYLILLDHDSRVPADFFSALEGAHRQYPKTSLFLPLVRARGHIVSPSDLYGCKGFHWKRPRSGRIRVRHRMAINSGMAIAVAYLRETFPGYDERLRFYGTDNFFMREYAKSNSHFVVLDCALEHDLSFFAEEDVETKLWRHSEAVAALRLLHRGLGIRTALTHVYCGVCNLRLAMKYRDLRFLLS